MEQPLVTIIGLSYNQAPFIKEALDSVLAQTYPNIQVILVDDASTDNSACELQKYARRQPNWHLLLLPENIGNTRAFNKALALAKGEFIIDFALDDVMLPERVAAQVEAFKKLGNSYGVIYTDAYYINEQSVITGTHSRKDGKLKYPTPSGDIFKEVLKRFFISTPTMMVRKEVFTRLNGYDENLYYEDFDFWIRSSRYYKYFYLDKILTKRRVHSKSMSQGWYSKGDPHLASTVIACEKAAALIRTEEEKEALIIRIKSEIRQTFFSGNFKETTNFIKLLKELGGLNSTYTIIEVLNKLRINLSPVRLLYYKIKYQQ